MEQVALGYSAAQDIADGVSLILKKGKFDEMSKLLGKLAPFLGAYGAMVNIIGLFGDSPEVQRLDKIMEMLNDGFQRVEYRFDRIEESLKDLENTIKEEHFWTRLRNDLATLNNAQHRVSRYFSVTDPAVRKERQNDLDDAEHNDVFDALNNIKGKSFYLCEGFLFLLFVLIYPALCSAS